MRKDHKSLLEQLYDGEFSPCELIVHKEPEYYRLLTKSNDAITELLGRLDSEDRERLDHVLDLRNSLASMDACTTFSCGLRTGMQLMYELFLSDALPPCAHS